MNPEFFCMSLTSSGLEEFDNVEKEADLPVPTNLATACPRDKDVSMLFLQDRFTQSPRKTNFILIQVLTFQLTFVHRQNHNKHGSK